MPQEATYAEIPIVDCQGVDKLALFARFGVGDMMGVEGAEDGVVTLRASSDAVCPMHLTRLLPDACRSCRFLAGEVA
jgi:hypothetical protein